MGANREWTTTEIEYLKRRYPKGDSAQEIGDRLGRTKHAVIMMAKNHKLRHPRHSTEQMIQNFEELHGRPVAEIAKEYRDGRLSRSALAADIGIDKSSLRRFLPESLWQSWPHQTIGRIDAAKTRRPPTKRNESRAA